MRRSKLVVGAISLLVLAGAGTGLALSLHGSTSGPAARLAGLTNQQQLRLQHGVTASTVVAQAAVVAREVRNQFVSRGQPLLPAGSRLSIIAKTFHALSAQMATVDATVTGPQPSRWQLVLVREAGEWLVLGTRQLS